jgi:hypothetical protein
MPAMHTNKKSETNQFNKPQDRREESADSCKCMQLSMAGVSLLGVYPKRPKAPSLN